MITVRESVLKAQKGLEDLFSPSVRCRHFIAALSCHYEIGIDERRTLTMNQHETARRNRTKDALLVRIV
jgi:hypothetical protein